MVGEVGDYCYMDSEAEKRGLTCDDCRFKPYCDGRWREIEKEGKKLDTLTQEWEDYKKRMK